VAGGRDEKNAKLKETVEWTAIGPLFFPSLK
jgi:hypothetical protein